MQALWQEVDELPGPEERTIMTGVAHGWGGYLYATLAWCRVTGAPLPAGVKMRLDALATLAEPYGRGARWPWDLPTKEGEKPQTMPGWCGGSVGQVLLWSLASDSYGDEGFAAIAEAAAWDCWDALREASTLCCDLAGRGYGLLNMYRRSGDKVWLRRAWRIAESAAAKNSFYKACPHSLFYGRTGLAVLQEDLKKPATAVFPFFEIEPGV